MGKHSKHFLSLMRKLEEEAISKFGANAENGGFSMRLPKDLDKGTYSISVIVYGEGSSVQKNIASFEIK